MSASDFHIETINSKARIATELALIRWIFLGMAGLVLLIGGGGGLHLRGAPPRGSIAEVAPRPGGRAPPAPLGPVVPPRDPLARPFSPPPPARARGGGRPGGRWDPERPRTVPAEPPVPVAGRGGRGRRRPGRRAAGRLHPGIAGGPNPDRDHHARLTGAACRAVRAGPGRAWPGRAVPGGPCGPGRAVPGSTPPPRAGPVGRRGVAGSPWPARPGSARPPSPPATAPVRGRTAAGHARRSWTPPGPAAGRNRPARRRTRPRRGCRSGAGSASRPGSDRRRRARRRRPTRATRTRGRAIAGTTTSAVRRRP